MAPYQGARARELLQNPMSVFALSKVRLDVDGRVTDALCGAYVIK
jgi:hypothetical protein